MPKHKYKQLEVSDNDLKNHFRNFSFSLSQYKEEYIPLIFKAKSRIPEHLCYLCPICLKNFIFFSPPKIRFTASFSLDHFPPENVGGSLTVLVCKSCNNKAGHDYEAKFKETIERECFHKKIEKAKIPTITTISNIRGWHRSHLDIDADGNYRFGLSSNDRKNPPELNEWKKKSKNDWEMKVTIRHPDEKKFVKTLLKTAYLYCFNHWRYDFVFSKVGTLFRKVLTDESEYPVKVPLLWLDNKSNTYEFDKIHQGVIFISAPKGMQSIFVNIPCELKHLGYKCILPIPIPNPTEKGIEEMKRIGKYLKENINVDTTMAPINPPNPQMIDSFLFTWESLINQFN